MPDSRRARNPALPATIPGRGVFRVTAAAVDRVRTLGGSLYCFVGPGGCGGTTLLFAIEGIDADQVVVALPVHDVRISLSPTLADRATGATLDYGASLKPPRFRWARLSVPYRCTCRRSFGEPSGPRPTPWCLSEVPQVVEMSGVEGGASGW